MNSITEFPVGTELRLPGGKRYRLTEIKDPPLRKAHLSEYLAWLQGYTDRGGKITHTYDYPFSRMGFLFADSDVTIESDEEFGALSREIIMAPGGEVTLTNTYAGFGGWGHSHVYYMKDYSTGEGGSSFVPVFSDKEFRRFRKLWKSGSLATRTS